MSDNTSIQLKNVWERMNKIFDSETLGWEEKYELIFSDRISRFVFDNCSLDYYDPDTSYEEDVKAFVNAFNEYMGTKSEYL